MTSLAEATSVAATDPTTQTAPGQRLVGNDTARALQGHSAGADVVLLAYPEVDVPETHLSGVSKGVSLGQLSAVVPVGEVLRAFDTRLPEVLGDAAAGGPGIPSSDLARLAELAGADLDVPLVLACGDLRTSLPALLDLLDRPGVGTAVATALPAAVSGGVDRLPAARVGGDGRLVESVGTGYHAVTGPNRVLPGVLRVAAADRRRVAEVWREASAVRLPGPADRFALAVLALVRAGVPVQAAPLGPFTWMRAGVTAPGAAGSPWQQRLRGASRGGDSVFSTLVTRRMSRPLTGFGLAHGWIPDLVTVVSLSTGVLAAGLVATGQRWAWVAAAVLLQVALVVDCVDGEIARFTRRFSAFGAWLDAVGDRVKEYAVCAALAAVAVRQGSEGWLLATLALALVSMRHLEDFPYAERLRPLRVSRPDLLPLSQARDAGPAGAPTTLPPPPSSRARVVIAVKQLLHLPIAERYLLICLGLLTFRPSLVLWALIAAVTVAAAYTQGGRVVRALRRRDAWTPPPGGIGWDALDHQMDLGPLARASGRRLRLPFAFAPVGVLLLAAAVLPDLRLRSAGAAPAGVAVAVVAAVLVGAATRPPLRHRLAWQLPVGLWLAEVAVVCGVATAQLPVGARGPAFAWAAAVAYHRYDGTYRLRDAGVPPAPELALLGLGCDGRVVLLLAVAAWAPGALGTVLAVGAAYLAVLYLTESVLGWRRLTARSHASTVASAPAASAPIAATPPATPAGGTR